ncbi:MAG: superoxide dismutase [Gammaproteobacteria bacterium]|nr:superoxide dismutase [Gammaproteobacteria bacterium]
MKRAIGTAIAGLSLIVGLGTAHAETVTVPVHELTSQGTGKRIGVIELRDTDFGLLILPDLAGLSPGKHGFHVHQNPTCRPGAKGGETVPGRAAGGHYDPGNAGRHEGPIGQGHLGDLPVLVVNDKGRATLPVMAPRLQVPDIVERALIVHAHGDNYADRPKPLGGGGARVACGVIPLP